MLRHVVLFRWSDTATDAAKRAVAEGLAALPSQIPEIRRYDFGADAGLADGNYDFALVADFASGTDFAAYQAHPAHVRLLSDVIRPAIASRVGMQYRLSGGG